jgi:hypothetical protein
LDDSLDRRARLYTAQISKYFWTRAGRLPVLTIDDWTCIRQWREQGIPLEYVFNGIDRAFAINEGIVTSLASCAPAVLEVWRYKLCS